MFELRRFAAAAVSPIVPLSFGRPGFRLRRAAVGAAIPDLDGRVCAVTGANAGIGLATARLLASAGARVLMLCRDRRRGESARAEVAAGAPRGDARVEVVDVASRASIRAFAGRLPDAPLDVLIHNAGVLSDERRETAEGVELTFATHVAGPLLLTELLTDRLLRAPDPRVILVSSGGMYTTRLQTEDPLWRVREYDGVRAYAETKRAQVVLAELWQATPLGDRVRFYSMHPGWADTGAVRSSLPRFHALMRPLLRSAAEGADTVAWLAATRPAPPGASFWLDRTRQRTHWLPRTRASDAERKALWRLAHEAAGLAPT